MTGDKLRSLVDSIISNKDSSLHLYLILKDNKEYSLRLANIDDKETMSELNRMFIKNLDETIVQNQEIVVRNLSKDDEAAGAIYEYDYDEYPEELNLFKTFNINDAVHTDKFDFNKDDINKLFGFIIYIGTMYKGLTLFKKHYPIALIKRDSFLLGVIKSKERFEMISGNDIIRMNSEWQLMSLNGEVLVRDISILERNLGFEELIKKNAERAIKSIEKLGIVSNIAHLSAEMENLTFARKLAMIQKSSVVLAALLTEDISINEFIQFSMEAPGLKGQFKYDDNKIILSTKAEKKTLLRLLNDDYLQSQLTEEYYAANSKDRLRKKSTGEEAK